MKFILYYGYTQAGRMEDNMKIFQLQYSDSNIPTAHNNA
jgi:hypothetical protein